MPLNGRNFVAHVVFSITDAAIIILSNDFRATVVRIATGIFEITLSDDTATADAVPLMKSTPGANSDVGSFVGLGWLRTAANTFRMFTYPATSLSAGGAFGFLAAQADPPISTVLTFSLDRVDEV